MSEALFRKTSMDKLQSPEQLDHLLTVTSAKSWIALLGITVLIGAVLIWSVTGFLPSYSGGNGTLIGSGGIHSIVSVEVGQISDISVAPGDRVRKGDVLLRLSQPELLRQIRDVEEQGKRASEAGQKEMLEKKLVSMREQLEQSTQVKSTQDGYVVEVKVRRGDLIQPGSVLVTMEKAGDTVSQLQAVLYVSPQNGEKIHEGMEVKLHPISIIKEEYGYMIGTVTAVDEFPSSPQSIVNTVGNEELAKILAGSGAAVKVTISLIPDAATISGYKWTTSEGPPVELNRGMMAEGMVTLEEVRPISKIFPAWR